VFKSVIWLLLKKQNVTQPANPGAVPALPLSLQELQIGDGRLARGKENTLLRSEQCTTRKGGYGTGVLTFTSSHPLH